MHERPDTRDPGGSPDFDLEAEPEMRLRLIEVLKGARGGYA